VKTVKSSKRGGHEETLRILQILQILRKLRKII